MLVDGTSLRGQLQGLSLPLALVWGAAMSDDLVRDDRPFPNDSPQETFANFVYSFLGRKYGDGWLLSVDRVGAFGLERWEIARLNLLLDQVPDFRHAVKVNYDFPLAKESLSWDWKKRPGNVE